MTPKEIVDELNRHIVGQKRAKKLVAVALRNRFRRMRVESGMQSEIVPKNILMIGPTGVGKTEIARRLAKLAKAPFIKVEATKFTEVGYVGRSVDSIIKDLCAIAHKQLKSESIRSQKAKAQDAAEQRILDALLPETSKKKRDEGVAFFMGEEDDSDSELKKDNKSLRDKFLTKLRAGDLDDKEIEVEVESDSGATGFMGEFQGDMEFGLDELFSKLRRPSEKKRMKVKDAMNVFLEEEAAKMVNEGELRLRTIREVENNGIVFIDEIDKVAGSDSRRGADVSREGVQRDLLPLVEGTTIQTKFGMVKTDHILFIASGAFHLSKPSDLIPEFQGRFPVRVELDSLSVEDFKAILTVPKASLTKQYKALLEVDGIDLEFTDDGINRIAELAYEVNEKTENIGARRLHTVLEKILEDISYEMKEGKCVIDKNYVEDKLKDIVQNQDVSRYIL